MAELWRYFFLVVSLTRSPGERSSNHLNGSFRGKFKLETSRKAGASPPLPSEENNPAPKIKHKNVYTSESFDVPMFVEVILRLMLGMVLMGALKSQISIKLQFVFAPGPYYGFATVHGF